MAANLVSRRTRSARVGGRDKHKDGSERMDSIFAILKVTGVNGDRRWQANLERHAQIAQGLRCKRTTFCKLRAATALSRRGMTGRAFEFLRLSAFRLVNAG